MSNEMIERVSLAISEITVHGDFSSEELARAAIAAMREPTQTMVDAGEVATGWNFSPKPIWECMIAAALGEQS